MSVSEKEKNKSKEKIYRYSINFFAAMELVFLSLMTKPILRYAGRASSLAVICDTGFFLKSILEEY